MSTRFRIDIRRYREFYMANPLTDEEIEKYSKLQSEGILNDIIESELQKLELYFNSYAEALKIKDYKTVQSIERGIDTLIKNKFVYRDFNLKKVRDFFKRFEIKDVQSQIKPAYYKLWEELYNTPNEERYIKPDSVSVYLCDFLSQFIINKGLMYLQYFTADIESNNYVCGCCGVTIPNKKIDSISYKGLDFKGIPVYYHNRCVKKSTYLLENINSLKPIIIPKKV